ncbi:MAG: beta-ketoacyl-[acyl-carrier-protein] synthase family protein [Terriglobales bacterium]
MKTVVITGLGVISPLGRGVSATTIALQSGHNGVRRIQQFERRGFPVQFAGEVTEPGIPNDGRRMVALAELALDEALENAGLNGASTPRCAFSWAVGKPGLDLQQLTEALRHLSPATGEALREQVDQIAPALARQRQSEEPPALTARLADRVGAGGARYCSYTACASGNDALGLGKRLIERGVADVVIAGATDAQVHPLGLLEFDLLDALAQEDSEHACRPFDRQRTGFVVGEGAAALVLEDLEHARRRGARIWGRLAGYGSSLDCYGLTKCHPEGRGAALAMNTALADAGLDCSAIGYINAHGTGTVLNDRAEAAAIHRVWGGRARQVPVSSTKSMTGHLIGAASAVEAVLTLLALAEGFLPATLNYATFDPECDLAVVSGAARPARFRAAMSNGFGFGGQNSALVLTAV